jgi:tetratricopeptide (TPR) repeat protein
VQAAATSQGFSRADVLRKADVSERQLREWEKAGLVAPAEAYDFSKLSAIRALALMKSAGLPLARIRRVLEAVVAKLDGITDPLTQVRVYIEGRRVRVQVGKQRMEPESGQLVLDLDGTGQERTAVLAPRIKEDHAAKQRKLHDAEQWFLRGVELEQAHAPVQQAIDAYQLAISLDPKLAAAAVNLGTIYFTSQDWPRAEKYYAKAIETNPDYPLAHFNIGNLYDERGDRARAREHYQKALDLDPRYSDAHYNLALLYQNEGQTMKAVRHWRAYIKLDPTSSWADVARRELDKLYRETVVPGRKNPA